MKNQETLNKIIEEVKASNEKFGVMAEDLTNERLLFILSSYDLEDDEDVLVEFFGVDGFHALRDAEKNI